MRDLGEMGETLEGLVVTLSLSMASYRPYRVLLKEMISTGNLDLQYWSAVVTPETKGPTRVITTGSNSSHRGISISP